MCRLRVYSKSSRRPIELDARRPRTERALVGLTSLLAFGAGFALGGPAGLVIAISAAGYGIVALARANATTGVVIGDYEKYACGASDAASWPLERVRVAIVAPAAIVLQGQRAGGRPLSVFVTGENASGTALRRLRVRHHLKPADAF